LLVLCAIIVAKLSKLWFLSHSCLLLLEARHIFRNSVNKSVHYFIDRLRIRLLSVD